MAPLLRQDPFENSDTLNYEIFHSGWKEQALFLVLCDDICSFWVVLFLVSYTCVDQYSVEESRGTANLQSSFSVQLSLLRYLVLQTLAALVFPTPGSISSSTWPCLDSLSLYH